LNELQRRDLARASVFSVYSCKILEVEVGHLTAERGGKLQWPLIDFQWPLIDFLVPDLLVTSSAEIY
jgi:hypothetical protein